MDRSEEQFQELIAHVVARANKQLKAENEMSPLGLMLTKSGDVDVSMCIDIEDLGEALNIIQADVTKKVENQDILATCIAYPNYADGLVMALLENNENYCAQVEIPVQVDEYPFLLPDELEINDGNIYIFPIVE